MSGSFQSLAFGFLFLWCFGFVLIDMFVVVIGELSFDHRWRLLDLVILELRLDNVSLGSLQRRFLLMLTQMHLI